MTFLIILIAMTVELLVVSFAAVRSDRWIRGWLKFLSAVFVRWPWWNGPAGVSVTVAIPAVTVVVLFNWLSAGPTVVVGAAGIALLLLTLGPADLNREIESYLVAYSAGVDDLAREPGITFLEGVETRAGESDRGVLGAILVAAHERLFAPVFWFAVLGPVGPVMYRMSAILAGPAGDLASFQRIAERLRRVMDWIPVRLFVAGLGLAGTLTPTLEKWRMRDDLSLGAADVLLPDAGLAALNYGILERIIGNDPHIYWVNAMHALVKRTITLCLALLAVVTLVAF